MYVHINRMSDFQPTGRKNHTTSVIASLKRACVRVLPKGRCGPPKVGQDEDSGTSQPLGPEASAAQRRQIFVLFESVWITSCSGVEQLLFESPRENM